MSFLASREMQSSLSAWYFACTTKPPHFISPLSNCFPKHFRIHMKVSCLLKRKVKRKKTQPIAKRHRSRGNPLCWCGWITQPLWLIQENKRKNKLLIQTSELIYWKGSPLPWHLGSGKAGFLSGLFVSLSSPQLHRCLCLILFVC